MENMKADCSRLMLNFRNGVVSRQSSGKQLEKLEHRFQLQAGPAPP
jgi:hypothetical protein